MSGFSLTLFETSLAVQSTVLQFAAQAVGQQPDVFLLTNNQFPEQTQEAITHQMKDWRVLSFVPTRFLEGGNRSQNMAPSAILWMQPRAVLAAHVQKIGETQSLQPAGIPPPTSGWQSPLPATHPIKQRPLMHPVLAEKIRRWGVSIDIFKSPPPLSDDERFASQQALHPLLRKKIKEKGIPLGTGPAAMPNAPQDLEAYVRGERIHSVLAKNIAERGIALPEESRPIADFLETAQGAMEPSWQERVEERALPLPAFSPNVGGHPFLITSASIYYINEGMPLSALLAIFKSGEAITNGRITLTLTLQKNNPAKPTLSLTVSSLSQEAIRHFAQQMQLPFLGTVEKIGNQFVFTFPQFRFRDGKTFLTILKQALLSR